MKMSFPVWASRAGRLAASRAADRMAMAAGMAPKSAESKCKQLEALAVYSQLTAKLRSTSV